MDLRKEAEARAQQREKNDSEDQNRRSSFRIQQRQKLEQKRLSIQSELQVNSVDYSSQINDTPKIAQLAEIDYKWNGARARAHNDNFIIPRWVPDEEIMYCHACNSEFDYVNRKHHCRHCGMVYCDPCSQHRVLVPHEFGYKDPVRVCNDCHAKLLPQQQYLSTNIANHQRVNNIDVASTNCNVRRYMNMPFSSTLGSEIRKAAYSTHNLFSQALYFVRDKAIPLRLLANAKGLAFITVIKGGFIFAPRLGTGLVVARLPDTADPALLASSGGWSAPTAIATVGVSWGAVIGVDVTDYVVILNTTEAVQAFSGLGQLSIGAGIEVAVGPVGRSGSADFHISDMGLAPAFSYSHSRGLFAGLSLDGSLIVARSEVNHCFYGRPVSPGEILGGMVPPPRAAAPLYDALTEALSSLPDVQHVHVQPGGAHSRSNSHRRQSGLNSSSTQDMSLAGDHTERAIQDIDNILSNSGLENSGSRSSSSSGGNKSHNNLQGDNRRRTMAHIPTAATHVHHDEVWGANSRHSMSSSVHNTAHSSVHSINNYGTSHNESAQDMPHRQQYTPFAEQEQHQYQQQQFSRYESSYNQLEDTEYTYTEGGAAEQLNVSQRKARHQSLPANFGAHFQTNVPLYPPPYVQQQVQHQQHQQQQQQQHHQEQPQWYALNQRSGDDCLGDVPRPSYAAAVATNSGTGISSGDVESGGGGFAAPGTGQAKSVIDEELECVTANLQMML